MARPTAKKESKPVLPKQEVAARDTSGDITFTGSLMDRTGRANAYNQILAALLQGTPVVAKCVGNKDHFERGLEYPLFVEVSGTDYEILVKDEDDDDHAMDHGQLLDFNITIQRHPAPAGQAADTEEAPVEPAYKAPTEETKKGIADTIKSATTDYLIERLQHDREAVRQVEVELDRRYPN